MRAVVALLLLMLLHSPPAPGADIVDSVRTLLVVTADLDGAPVAVNGSPAGVTPLTIDSLPAGIHVVSVRHPSVESWFAGVVNDTVALAAGDTARVHATLRRRLHLVSDPAGVPVFADDSLVGFTPVVLGGPSLAGGEVVMLRPPGALPVRVVPADARATVTHYRFAPWEVGDEGRVVSVLREEGGLPLRVYFAGGAAILSGVAAATWKVRADAVYADYRNSRDPAARNRTRRLDSNAALALAAMQITLGLFVYFVVSE